MNGLLNEYPPVLRWPHVTRLFGLSRRTIERDIAAGKFPAGSYSGVGNRWWTRAELEGFITSNPQGRERRKAGA